jgi:hypothetical protein
MLMKEEKEKNNNGPKGHSIEKASYSATS